MIIRQRSTDVHSQAQSYFSTVVRTVAFLCIVLVSIVACRAESPVVIGFDRFARYDEDILAAGGHLLLTELSCTACHQTDEKLLRPKGGPDLSGVGNRLSHDWIKQFIARPDVVKPGTTMPQMLHDLPAKDREQQAAALAAFLSEQRKPFPELRSSGANPVPFQFWEKGNVELGQNLYHQIGCVACHAPDETYEGGTSQVSPLDQLLQQLDPEDLEEMGLMDDLRPIASIPHSQLPQKYTTRSLTFFLLDPASHRPSGRMPNFKLEPIEAAHLTAYLLQDEQKTGSQSNAEVSGKLIAEGKKLFQSAGCVNCHQLPGLKQQGNTKRVAELNPNSENNCLSQRRSGLPFYELDEVQRAALTQTIEHKNNWSEAELLRFSMWQLNCYACHERDQQGGVGPERKQYFETAGHVDIGDEGRLPPSLSGVGRKLEPAWMQKVFAGRGDLRPFMRARMPIFPAQQLEDLPSRFSQVDAHRNTSETEVFGKLDGLETAGRELLDTGCVQCHSLHDEQIRGVVGLDIGEATTRISPEWFKAFLLDPAALKERTRMPTFFPHGKSANQEILNGNVDQQIAAIWSYLKKSNQLPLPEKILKSNSENFELIPTDKPIVLRTFMEESGTHTLAIGFPGGINLAYDTADMRLAQLWKGRFLDAYGTWFVRFTPPAEPLGTDLLTLPNDSFIFEVDGKSTAWRFHGFRLNEKGNPVLLSQLGAIQIEESFLVTLQDETDSSKPGLTRVLKFQVADAKQHRLTINTSNLKPTSPDKNDSTRVDFRFSTYSTDKTESNSLDHSFSLPETQTIVIHYVW